MKLIPFDLDAAQQMPEWRKDFVWPLPHHIMKPIIRNFAQRLMKEIIALEDNHLRNIMLMSSWAISDSYFTIETALLVQAAEKLGLQMVGGPEEVYRLQNLHYPVGGSRFTPRATLDYRPIKHQALRRIARTFSWTKWHNMLSTYVDPQAIAVSHNGVMRAHAASSNRRIFFRQAESYMTEARERAAALRTPFPEEDITPIFELLSKVISETKELSPQMVQFAQDKITQNFMLAGAELDRNLKSVALIRKLPNELWMGSAGHVPARMLALEVQKRGGTVTAHDHSGAAGTVAETESLVFAELSVADRFVVSTEGMKKNLLSSDAMDRVSDLKTPEIIVGNGDPTFRNFSIPYRAQATKRPNVMYIFGNFEGIKRRSPPALPDPVKLDWWSRMSRMMLDMPINFKIQPHPGGVLRGKPNPIAEIAPPTGQNLEKSAEWADIFVIDITQSTTIPLSLCTGRHVVLIDYGRNEFSPEMQPLINNRCVTVKASFNEQNLPVVDKDELEAAIFSTQCDQDPSIFKQIYAG